MIDKILNYLSESWPEHAMVLLIGIYVMAQHFHRMKVDRCFMSTMYAICWILTIQRQKGEYSERDKICINRAIGLLERHIGDFWGMDKILWSVMEQLDALEDEE